MRLSRPTAGIERLCVIREREKEIHLNFEKTYIWRFFVRYFNLSESDRWSYKAKTCMKGKVIPSVHSSCGLSVRFFTVIDGVSKHVQS